MNERIAARIILLNQDNQVLLLHMHEQTSYWLTPGGGQEHHERLFATAKRELFEETGIDNANINPEPSWYSESILSYKDQPTLFKQHYFLGRVMNADVSFDHLQEDEHLIKDYQWMSIQQLNTLTDRVYPQSLPAILTDYFAHGLTNACKTINEILSIQQLSLFSMILQQAVKHQSKEHFSS